MASEDYEKQEEKPGLAFRIFIWLCVGLAGVFVGQLMPKSYSLQVLTPTDSLDAIEKCVLGAAQAAAVVPGSSSPALKKLLAARIEKTAVTPDLQAWAASLESPAVDDVQTAVNALVEDIKAKAPAQYRETCLDIVTGRKLSTFGKAYEDWVLFNSFFRTSNVKYGSGFYVDINDGNPETDSPGFFFDVCLGWEGLCIPTYHGAEKEYSKARSCKVAERCDAKGNCKVVEDILAKENVQKRKVDVVAMRWKNSQFRLRCFPFDAFNMPLWHIWVEELADSNKWKLLDLSMGAAGYWKAPSLMARVPDAASKSSGYPKDLLGYRYSYIYLSWPKSGPAPDGSGRMAVPPMVLGPSWGFGQPRYGTAFPACDPAAKEGDTACPVGVPTIDIGYERTTKTNKCPPFQGVMHRLSY